MEFLGVGPLELLFILLIAIIVLGPADMVKTGRTLGRVLRKIVTSPTWKTILDTSRGLRYLPNKLIREAGLEEEAKDLNQIRRDLGQLRSELPSVKIPDESISPSAASSPADGAASIAPAGDFSSWTTPVVLPSPPPPSLEPPAGPAPTEPTPLGDTPAT
jgi:hypothetical protein